MFGKLNLYNCTHSNWKLNLYDLHVLTSFKTYDQNNILNLIIYISINFIKSCNRPPNELKMNI